ncbi:hypothetical protein FOA52_000827 [Chlamydomonas sp. UWO 241]|nr:hypothetical protein FOA52_000827 [Chlamydomonas sp. UWO 241]
MTSRTSYDGPRGLDAVLTETVHLHEEATASRTALAMGAAVAVASPDETMLAIIDESREVLSLVAINPAALSQPQPPPPEEGSQSAGGSSMGALALALPPPCRVHRFSYCMPPAMQKQQKSKGAAHLPPANAPDALSAVCWSPDGSKVVVATGSGCVYVLDRSGAVVSCVMPDKAPFPWHGPGVAALAMPTEDRVLLLTAEAQLFTLPMSAREAHAHAYAALKPTSLKAFHGRTLAMALHPSSLTLAVLGEGGNGKPIPGRSVSLWGVQGVTPRLAHSLGQACALRKDAATQSAAPGAPAHVPWCATFSPTGEYIAVACGAHGLAVVGVDGQLVDLGLEKAAAAAAAAAAAGANGSTGEPHGGNVAALAKAAVSVSWWATGTLCLVDRTGALALARTPSFVNTLGSAPREAPVQLPPGSQALALRREDGAVRGVLTLTPTSGQGASAPGGGGGAQQQGGAAGWKLSLLVERGADEMMKVHMAAGQWGRALSVARAYSIDADAVYRVRWLQQPVSSDNIDANLTPMTDRYWVAEECAMRLADGPSEQRALLEYCLGQAALHCWGPNGKLLSGDDLTLHVRWWRRMRLLMLRHLDRLDTLLALHKGVFDGDAFNAFRHAELLEAAVQYAASGDVSSLTVLLQHHPVVLAPHLLELLDALPESLDPRLYASLLPKADGACGVSPRQSPRPPDWVEGEDTVTQLLENEYTVLLSSTEHVLLTYQGGVPSLPSPDAVSEWYASRALLLDGAAGQLAHAVTLLEAAVARGVPGRAGALLAQAHALRDAVAGSGAQQLWTLSLEQFSAQPPDQQVLTMLCAGAAPSDSTPLDQLEEQIDSAIDARATLYCGTLPAGTVDGVLAGLLASQMHSSPAWCAALVRLEASRMRLFSSPGALARAVLSAVSSSERIDAWEASGEMLSTAEAALDEAEQDAGVAAGSAELLDELARMRGAVHACSVLSARGMPLSVRAMRVATAGSAAAALGAVMDAAAADSDSVGGWGDREWRGLAEDLQVISECGLTVLDPVAVLAAFVQALLRARRLPLAASFLSSGGIGGARLPLVTSEALLLAASRAARKGASSLASPGLRTAREVLGIAADLGCDPQGPAAAELRLLEALSWLTTMDLDDTITPDDVLSETDRTQVVRKVLEAGRHLPLHRHLAPLLDLAGLLGVPDAPRAVPLLAATEALSMGDLATATQLALELVEARYEPAWRVAATIGMEAAAAPAPRANHGNDEDGDDNGDNGVDDDDDADGSGCGNVRTRLLSFAAARCDAEALPQLLEELAAGDLSAASTSASGRPARPAGSPAALAAQLCSDAPPCATDADVAPSLGGDAPGALAALLATPGGAAGITAAVRAATDAAGGAHAVSQRATLLGVAALCLRALLPGTPPGARAALLGAPPRQLLDDARAKAAAAGVDGGVDGAAAAVAASEQLLSALRAADDSRAVRAVVPSADPDAFRSGDTASQRCAILQQAEVAGRKSAAALDSGEATDRDGAAGGGKLLTEALSLARAYGAAAPWEVRARYVVGALAAAPRAGPLLRADAVAQAREALGEAGADEAGSGAGGGARRATAAAALARALAVEVWPGGPPHSAPHCAAVLAVLAECIGALAEGGDGGGGGEASVDCAASASDLLPRVAKARELLDKAGGALKGLRLRALVTPLLRPLLAVALPGPREDEPAAALPHPPGALLPQPGSAAAAANGAGAGHDAAAAGAGDPELAALVSEAQAAVHAYVDPGNAGTASKLVKALHSIFAPRKDAGFGGADGGAALSKVQAKSLASLPASLPHLCVLIKLTSRPGGRGSEPCAALSMDAWAPARASMAKVTGQQLRSWLSFLLLRGRQPLPVAAAGKLSPMHLDPHTRTALLEECLPVLVTAASAAAATSDGVGGATTNMAEAVARLTAQYARARAWHAAAAAARDDYLVLAVHAQQLGDALGSSADGDRGSEDGGGGGGRGCSGDGGGGGGARASVVGCVDALLAAGCSVHGALGLARAAAAPGPVATTGMNADSVPSEAGGAAAEVVGAAAALPGVELDEGGGSGGGGGEAARQLVAGCLQRRLASCLSVLLPEGVGAQVARFEGGEAGALAGLRALVASLAAVAPTAATPQLDGSAGADGSAGDVAALRASLWAQLSASVGALPPAAYSRPSVCEALELQASLSSLWPGWAPPVGAGGAAGGSGGTGGGSMPAGLLLGRTLAALGGAWPDAFPDASDVSDVESATALFSQLLGSAAGGVRQHHLLTTLLGGTWADGGVWGAAPVHVAAEGAGAGTGPDGDGGEAAAGAAPAPHGHGEAQQAQEAQHRAQQQQQAQVDGPLAPPVSETGTPVNRLTRGPFDPEPGEGGERGTQPGAREETPTAAAAGSTAAGSAPTRSTGWTCSALHGCWAELGLALLRGGHDGDAARMVDACAAHVAAGSPAQLSLPSLAALLEEAQRRDGGGSLTAAALGMLSPVAAHRDAAQRTLMAMEETSAGGASDADAAMLRVACAAAAACAEPGAAACLAACEARWRAVVAALTPLPPHPAAARAAAPHARPAAAELAGCVVPALACQLTLCGRGAWAGALVADQLRLHPSLAGLNGSLTMLEKFLADSGRCAWVVAPHHSQLVGAGAEQPSEQPGGVDASPGDECASLAWAAPHALLAAAGVLAQRCEAAARCLGADLRA